MTTEAAGDDVNLTAPYVLKYSYKRTLGPILSQFFTGLRDGKIMGAKLQDGRIMVPPAEYDPDTGDDVEGLVEVSETGVVTSWSWVEKPRQVHPLDKPFAWALIKLDGADTSMLHALDVSDSSTLETGMRVKARWKAERVGYMTDIECFEPEGES